MFSTGGLNVLGFVLVTVVGVVCVAACRSTDGRRDTPLEIRLDDVGAQEALVGAHRKFVRLRGRLDLGGVKEGPYESAWMSASGEPWADPLERLQVRFARPLPTHVSSGDVTIEGLLTAATQWEGHLVSAWGLIEDARVVR